MGMKIDVRMSKGLIQEDRRIKAGEDDCSELLDQNRPSCWSHETTASKELGFYFFLDW